MSLLSALDATRVADRLVDDSDDARWARPIAVPQRQAVAAAAIGYSWWSLARNPNALLLTGMMGVLVVRDAVRGALT